MQFSQAELRFLDALVDNVDVSGLNSEDQVAFFNLRERINSAVTEVEFHSHSELRPRLIRNEVFSW